MFAILAPAGSLALAMNIPFVKAVELTCCTSDDCVDAVKERHHEQRQAHSFPSYHTCAHEQDNTKLRTVQHACVPPNCIEVAIFERSARVLKREHVAACYGLRSRLLDGGT